MGLLIAIFYLAAFLGYKEFTNIEMLNVATLFISIGSFIPLISVSLPLNKYRGTILVLAAILVASFYLWSMFGINWLLINGNSPAPRFIGSDELLAVLILLAAYFLIYLCFLSIVKYKGKIHVKLQFRK